MKGKGETERYSHLNAEFQRIAWRDKKAFLSDQCKEIEENNRMRKTRDLLKKIRDTKGTFHAKMGKLKDRNGMDSNRRRMKRAFHLRLFVTPWTIARQAPLGMGFPGQEYWSGLPCLPAGDLPDPGINPVSLSLLLCRQVLYH